MWLLLKLLKNLRETRALRESRKSEPYRLSNPFEAGCLPTGKCDRARGKTRLR
jgi:hypothetical protein